MKEQEVEKEIRPSLPLWARIVLILISFVVLSAVFQLIGVLLLGIPIEDIDSLKNLNIDQFLLLGIITFISTALVVYLFRKFIDKKSILSMGFSLKKRAKDILSGFIFSLVLFGGGTLILQAMGYIDIAFAQIDLRTFQISRIDFRRLIGQHSNYIKS